MAQLSVVSKESHQTLQSGESSQITLSENSVVLVNVLREEVASVVRQGNAAVITLKNGEVIVIDDFFKFTDNTIVFTSESGELYWVEFTNQEGVVDALKYYLVEDQNIGPLLYSDVPVFWPWVLGAVAIGGIAAAAGSGSSSGEGFPPKPDWSEVEALVKAAEEKHQAAQDVLADAQADGVITADEYQAIQDAVKDAQDAEQLAQDAVDTVTDSPIQDGFQDRLDALEPIDVPAVNDPEALVADAEAKQAAAEEALDKANEDGVITAEEKQNLDALAEAAETAKDLAQDAVDIAKLRR